jgi:serine/threonine-protein kinase
MKNCPICRTQNLDTSYFCDECGASLSEVEPIAEPIVASNVQNFQPANVTSVDFSNFESEEKKSVAKEFKESVENEENSVGINAKLVIERGTSVGTEFFLTTAESYIGRWDADNGIFPDIDLDAHDPEAKVSRKHARITQEDGKFSLEDLGSTNGTFVNRGRRLLPGVKHLLNDGDEIIVGKTFFRFHIIN